MRLRRASGAPLRLRAPPRLRWGRARVPRPCVCSCAVTSRPHGGACAQLPAEAARRWGRLSEGLRAAAPSRGCPGACGHRGPVRASHASADRGQVSPAPPRQPGAPELRTPGLDHASPPPGGFDPDLAA
ncbi:hypothetical protein CapIbe_009753 [Capra ibex]